MAGYVVFCALALLSVASCVPLHSGPRSTTVPTRRSPRRADHHDHISLTDAKSGSDAAAKDGVVAASSAAHATAVSADGDSYFLHAVQDLLRVTRSANPDESILLIDADTISEAASKKEGGAAAAGAAKANAASVEDGNHHSEHGIHEPQKEHYDHEKEHGIHEPHKEHYGHEKEHGIHEPHKEHYGHEMEHFAHEELNPLVHAVKELIAIRDLLRATRNAGPRKNLNLANAASTSDAAAKHGVAAASSSAHATAASQHSGNDDAYRTMDLDLFRAPRSAAPSSHGHLDFADAASTSDAVSKKGVAAATSAAHATAISVDKGHDHHYDHHDKENGIYDKKEPHDIFHIVKDRLRFSRSADSPKRIDFADAASTSDAVSKKGVAAATSAAHATAISADKGHDHHYNHHDKGHGIYDKKEPHDIFHIVEDKLRFSRSADSPKRIDFADAASTSDAVSKKGVAAATSAAHATAISVDKGHDHHYDHHDKEHGIYDKKEPHDIFHIVKDRLRFSRSADFPKRIDFADAASTSDAVSKKGVAAATSAAHATAVSVDKGHDHHYNHHDKGHGIYDKKEPHDIFHIVEDKLRFSRSADSPKRIDFADAASTSDAVSKKGVAAATSAAHATAISVDKGHDHHYDHHDKEHGIYDKKEPHDIFHIVKDRLRFSRSADSPKRIDFADAASTSDAVSKKGVAAATSAAHATAVSVDEVQDHHQDKEHGFHEKKEPHNHLHEKKGPHSVIIQVVKELAAVKHLLRPPRSADSDRHLSLTDAKTASDSAAKKGVATASSAAHANAFSVEAEHGHVYDHHDKEHGMHDKEHHVHDKKKPFIHAVNALLRVTRGAGSYGNLDLTDAKSASDALVKKGIATATSSAHATVISYDVGHGSRYHGHK